MTRINNPGTYRGRIANHAVTESSGKFPQFAANLIADEYFDTDGEPGWAGLQDKPDTDCYLVLIDGKDRKTLNCTQVEKVTGWDGVSLVDLDNLSLAEHPIQFRVEEHTYTPVGGQPKTQLQVTWIDVYDAIPGRKVSKLEPDAVKAIQAKFSKVLGGGKPAVASAKAPVKTPPKAPVVKTPAATPKVPARKPTVPKIPAAPGKCTMEEAFAYISNQELWKKDIDQKKVEDTWLCVVMEIAGNKEDKDVTPEEWCKIKEKVASLVFVF